MKINKKLESQLKDLTELEQINFIISNFKNRCTQMIYSRLYLREYVLSKTQFLNDPYYKFNTRLYYAANSLTDFIKCKYDNKPIKRNIYSIHNPLLNFCSNRCRRLFFNNQIINGFLQKKDEIISNRRKRNNGKILTEITLQKMQKTRRLHNNGNYCSDKEIEKKKQDNLKYYSSEKFKSIVKSGFYKNINQKGNQTKKENGTFNTSKQEEIVYELLIELFGKTNILRQYKSEKYPFNCDFYIKQFDVYIECNFSWTHNNHFFNNLDNNDLKILSKLKEKAKTSKYYENAITTWTIRDIQKYNTAIKNNLNYIVFWNLNDVKYIYNL